MLEQNYEQYFKKTCSYVHQTNTWKPEDKNTFMRDQHSKIKKESDRQLF